MGRVKRAAAILVWMVFSVVTHGQGSFFLTLTITGSELIGGQPSPVTGTGSMQLSGGMMNYHIFVPVTVRPAETHFHGPRVDAEMPQFSLAPYEPQPSGGIVFRGTHVFNQKYVPDIRAGNWYVQMHSPQYVNGVMLGFMVPVPEPNTWSILIAGGLALCYLRAAPPKARISSRDKARS